MLFDPVGGKLANATLRTSIEQLPGPPLVSTTTPTIVPATGQLINTVAMPVVSAVDEAKAAPLRTVMLPTVAVAQLTFPAPSVWRKYPSSALVCVGNSASSAALRVV